MPRRSRRSRTRCPSHRPPCKTWRRTAGTAALTVRVTVTLQVPDVGSARRWSMLGASTLAQAAAAVMLHGPAFLIPALHEREGMSLAEAGAVAAAPTVGVMLTLVAWGIVTD